MFFFTWDSYYFNNICHLTCHQFKNNCNLNTYRLKLAVANRYLRKGLAISLSQDNKNSVKGGSLPVSALL